QHGEVTAVVDWELASVGPPEQDVARTHVVLSTLPGVSGVGRRLLGGSARRVADRFLEAYEARRPLDRAVVDDWRVAHARRLIEVARGSGGVADQWRPTVPALEAVIADAGGNIF
ncbi:MAG TPA: phosphotransferase, partial [Acidimicrobiales bacterium]